MKSERGAIHGLHLAWELSVSRVILEMDNQCLVDMLLNKSTCPLRSLPLIQEIKCLLQRSWTVEIVHVFREANKCADHLASLASAHPVGVHTLQVPPDSVKSLLFYDTIGVAFSRGH